MVPRPPRIVFVLPVAMKPARRPLMGALALAALISFVLLIPPPSGILLFPSAGLELPITASALRVFDKISARKLQVPHPLYRPTKNKLIPCVDQLCVSLHGGLSRNHKCDSPKQQCDYEIKYADQASSLGVLINDSFTVRLSNASVVRPSLAFGCGYDQEVGSSTEVAPTDGVLGLGSGSISLLSQLKQHGVTKNVVGHCLSMRGGGFLFFGDNLVPYSRATWVPMVRSAFR